jgi:bifunctional ADP-heptose synthase (sugar kinase/adenylyltransferase)
VTLQRIRTSARRARRAQRFRDARECDSVLITRGEHGMWLLGPTASSICPRGARGLRRHRRRRHRHRRDGARPRRRRLAQDAARLANRAAGLAVARFGPVAITAEELRRRL